MVRRGRGGDRRTTTRAAAPWPSTVPAVVLDALHRARRDDGDGSVAARLVVNERALHSRVRAAAADRLFELVRSASRLDARIRHALPRTKLDAATRDRWRLAASMMEDAGAAPASVCAALDLPVDDVTRLTGEDYLQGLTGAERLAVRHGMPGWLVDTLVSQRGEPFTDALLGALNARAPLTLRATRPRHDVLARLAADGVDAVPTRFSPLGITLRSHLNVAALAAHRAGLVEVQDEGSQLIALCVAPRAGETILDGCAGAGGKALALCALEPRCSVVALEPVASRLAQLRPRAARAGVHITAVRGAVGSPACTPYAGRADAVLLDAPCSGTGAIRREPAGRWRYSPDDIRGFSEAQAAILRAAVPLLKPGGRLVYATCSLLREENEDVITAFLAETPQLRPLPLAALLGGARAEALGADGHQLRLWPSVHGTDGFYVAALELTGWK